MEKIEMDIVALSHTVTQSNNYAVVLGEKFGERRLPIVIGAFEAQSIAVALEGMTPNRPLTHDLFKNTMDSFDIVLKEVVISNLLDGVFYSRLVCEKGGEEMEIDSRTSDAVALAVRFEAPIFTFEFILDAAGVLIDSEEQAKKPKKVKVKAKKPKIKQLSNFSDKELEHLLNDVLANEDYEKAAKIRDEIDQRKK